MRSALLTLAVSLLSCPAGNTWPDGGAPDASADASCVGAECDDGGPCDGVVCGDGQRCEGGTCVIEDLCADVVCPSSAEVCDPRDGTCRAGSTDADRDGFTIAEGDCNDSNPSIAPGAVEICDGVDQDCDLEVDELLVGPCTTDCGRGEARCLDGTWVCSVPDTCECTPLGFEDTEPCGYCGTRSRACVDWAWADWTSCDGAGECDPSGTTPCTTECGSTGAMPCSDDCRLGPCQLLPETCNGEDDDCDGDCDEGCRHRVYRCHDESRSDHYFTTTAGLCGSLGHVYEPVGDFFLYNAEVPGTAELYECRHPTGLDHVYTTSSDCDGEAGWTNEGSIGFIGTREFCGALRLYRLHHVGRVDHLYTVVSSEVDHALSVGYVHDGTAGWVWLSD